MAGVCSHCAFQTELSKPLYQTGCANRPCQKICSSTGQVYFQYLDTPTVSVYAAFIWHQAQDSARVFSYTRGLRTCAKLWTSLSGSCKPVCTATRRCARTRVRMHTAARARAFQDSVTCCATQAPGLQFVTPCAEEA